MKKILLSLLLIPIAGFSQNLIIQNFDVFPTSWTQTNQSTTAGTTEGSTWTQGNATSNTYINGGAGGFNGGLTSYSWVNFNSTTGNSTISNWLITPVVSLMNGDVISFYIIKGLSGGGTVYPDNMQVRISPNGASTVNPSGDTGVGGFTTLALEINPTLSTTGYPTTWTLYTYTVTGLPTATSCKIAFRYFVTSGGPSGSNSDYIGLDQFSVDRTLGTADFFKSNFTIYPNPSSDVISISNNNSVAINSIEVSDINGRIIKNVEVNSTTFSVRELNAGVYFLKVTTADGVGTTKFIKQ